MTLQNRVFPDGEIVAHPMHGLYLGNRGGVIHDHTTKTLHPTKRWASRQWICCVLDFKGRHRTVMSPNTYTELFFYDEVTALAAGHRPCFECRRADAVRFAQAWQRSINETAALRAPAMDKILHAERLIGKTAQKNAPEIGFEKVANGSMVRHKSQLIARKAGKALLWTPSGYETIASPVGLVDLLTPRSINDHVLKNGYEPHWHPSADK